ncbi:MAG TPA: ATP-binding protein [Candidatus Angelobacter sp.]|nr:ATP-binding protein [Candidatus Angelobacter sp.]
MHFSPSTRLRIGQWILVVLLTAAAWEIATATLTRLPLPAGVFFAAAAVVASAAAGLLPGLGAAVLNSLALLLFCYFHPGAGTPRTVELWSLLLASVALMIGYARRRWLAAESRADNLEDDLAQLRDELDAQRADLKRFHDFSVTLSSSLELQRLLNDILGAIATLQKTDLALLLLLPESSSKILQVETYAGFSTGQVKLFGEFPAALFCSQRKLVIPDLDAPGTYFPFMEAARQVGFRAVFSSPIINGRGEALGAVATFFRQPHTPSERQSRAVELYARQAANALDNARLYRSSLDTLAVERQRSAVLRSLAEASLQINSTLTIDSLLRIITDQARQIVAARQAFTTYLPGGDPNRSITCTSVEQGEEILPFSNERSEMFMLACSLNQPVRITSAIQGNLAWRNMVKSHEAARAGWLAAPLLTRDGRNLGLIQLSRKIHGEFSEDDQAILVHLAHMASVALDNVRLYREAQEKIAETKRAQEALQRSKESMQLAQRCVGIGIWEWDLQSGRLAWSEEVCRMHGIEPAGFDGRYETWMESIHLDDSWRVQASLGEALNKGGDSEVQYRVSLPDKSLHWLELRGQTIAMGNTPVRMLGVAIDVSSRKLVEDALRRSEKLAATGQLAASIAHEINNPLAAVTNVLYIVSTHPHMPADLKELMRTGERELERVIHITKQTLAFYREVSLPVMTSVPSLIHEVLDVYSRKIAAKSISVDRQFDSAEDIRAFPGELRQVFSNLLLNSVEAVADSGKIVIRVRPAKGANSEAGLRITMADNGPGIAPEHVSRIFEPFFTTKEAKGTGLGLWVSQGIVQKHRGSIRLRTSVDGARHGTSIAVFIPYDREGGQGDGEMVAESSGSSARSSAA